jgi:hypothetical protein
MRFRLRTLLIVMAAAPLWIYVTTIAGESRMGFDRKAIVVAPVLLAGISAALYWLTRPLRDGLAIAVLLSPIILSCLS